MLESSIINSVMGKFNKAEEEIIFSCLSKEEMEKLNHIGYSGKNFSGKKISQESYLNSLKKGEWILTIIKRDGYEFTETFSVSHAY